MMGFAAWLSAGAAALLVARLISIHRRSIWLEGAVALVTSLAAGMVATAFDFGGWAEPDPRGFFFCLFVSLATLGLLRAISLYRRSTDH